MKLKLALSALVLPLAMHLNAQVDTLPFTLNKQLLVFTGKMNGADVGFAFDTGASIGVANSDNLAKANFKVKNSGKRVNDSNEKITKMNNVVIEDLAIGNQHFSNVKSVFANMEFLQCNGLYLLGMNVIGKLNWKIDFVRKQLYISKQPFTVDASFTALPVSNINERPKASFLLNGTEYSKCLIDFGFNGTFDIPENSHTNQLYLQKQGSANASIAIGSNMGLAGLGKPDTVKTFFADSMLIAGQSFTNVPVTIKEKTDLKVGLNFFVATCNQVIINNNANSYYLQYKQQPSFYKKLGFDSRISLVDGKLVVTAKNLLANSTASQLSIQEEIKSINGKTTADFENSCAYFMWSFYNSANEIIIEKMNGEKVTVQRRELP